jgi:N-alpha-acetyltransferase 35, NatC auxiliary subunit
LSLFDDISASEFIKLLTEALEIVETEIGKQTSQSLEGIKARLEFRLKFLEIVSGTISSTKARRSALENCINMLPTITATMNLGKELPQAFSTRIQRKLSTQVPPRPMVTIDPKEAETSLKTLLFNLLEIECIYEYNSPHEIMVLCLLNLANC